MLHVALLEPEIAGNTGQIARTCLAAGCRLHLIRPLGFRLDAAALRRAGMDYWEHVDVQVHAGYAAFRQALAPEFAAGRVFGFTAHAAFDPSAPPVDAGPDAVLLFGPESRGLPDAVLAETRPVRLPMRPGTRSLNLAAAVAAAVYLTWAREGFEGGC
ncbi:MAG: TrmH family RNA methyltransferase [Deinococcales bacterium]